MRSTPERPRGARCRSGVGRAAVAGGLLVLFAPPGCAAGPLDAVALAPNGLADALIAHYTFDEGNGGVVTDHSGNKRDGALSGGTWISDGQFGGALHLAGTDFVTISNFPNAPSNFTVSAWVRSGDAPMDRYETIASTEIVFQGGWQLNLDKTATATGVHAAYWDATVGAYTYYECPCLPANQWTHVTSVVDENAHTLSVYVGNQLENVTAAPRPIRPGSPALYLGRWSGQGRLLVGDIDDIAIYGRALAPAEVAQLGLSPAPDPN